MFCKLLEKCLKMMLNIILRKLPSHHGEISVMSIKHLHVGGTKRYVFIPVR